MELKYGIHNVGNFQLLGFATGAYSCNCMICGIEFTGDKRAIECLACAINRANHLLDASGKTHSTPTGGEAENKLKSVMLQLGEIGCDIAEFLDGKPQPTGEGE